MSTFKDYLTEAVKSYDYKIKVAGAPKDIDKNALETALRQIHSIMERTDRAFKYSHASTLDPQA